jgi:hypothetical protein
MNAALASLMPLVEPAVLLSLENFCEACSYFLDDIIIQKLQNHSISNLATFSFHSQLLRHHDDGAMDPTRKR